MAIIAGQGLLLRLPFADGGEANYPRTFLVTQLEGNAVCLLNVSSVSGKERKLLFPSNKNINYYHPPFMRPSFVKLDALYILEYFQLLDTKVLANGETIDPIELTNLVTAFNTYRTTRNIHTANYDIGIVLQHNNDLSR